MFMMTNANMEHVLNFCISILCWCMDQGDLENARRIFKALLNEATLSELIRQKNDHESWVETEVKKVKESHPFVPGDDPEKKAKVSEAKIAIKEKQQECAKERPVPKSRKENGFYTMTFNDPCELIKYILYYSLKKNTKDMLYDKAPLKVSQLYQLLVGEIESDQL